MVVQRLGLGIMYPFAFSLLLAAPSGRIVFALSPSPVQPMTLPFSTLHPFIASTGRSDHLLEEVIAPLHAFAQGRVPLIWLPVDTLGLPSQTLAACKLDALSLQQAGFGAPAGVASQTDGIRANVHQIWLQSPRPDDPRFSADTNLQYVMVGQMAARRDLIRWVDSLRQYLETSRGPTAAPLSAGAVELSYVLYPTGAYYRQHVDQSQTSDSSRRAISFVLYLGDPASTNKDDDDDDDDNDDNEHEIAGGRPWDCVTDGGALRVYGKTPAAVACTGNTVVVSISCENEKGERDDDDDDDDDLEKSESCRYYADITPTAGSLVIFDSATVLHEVRTTHRPRAAIVGWFRESVAEVVAEVVAETKTKA
jgi:hypothetical protein